MTQSEFIKELETITGIKYSEENSKFFYTAIINQFKAFKKTYIKLEAYVKAHKDLSL
jgi:hypothetical protein